MTLYRRDLPELGAGVTAVPAAGWRPGSLEATRGALPNRGTGRRAEEPCGGL